MIKKTLILALTIGTIAAASGASAVPVASVPTKSNGVPAPSLQPVQTVVKALQGEPPAVMAKNVYLDGRPVILLGVPLTEKNRSSDIQRRLDVLAAAAYSNASAPIGVTTTNATVQVTIGEKRWVVMTVTHEDLLVLGEFVPSQKELPGLLDKRATAIGATLTRALTTGRHERTSSYLTGQASALGIVWLKAIGVVLIVLPCIPYGLRRRLFRRQLRIARLVPSEIQGSLAMLGRVRWIGGVIAIVWATTVSLEAFPWTRWAATAFMEGLPSWISGGVGLTLAAFVSQLLSTIIGYHQHQIVSSLGPDSRAGRKALTLLPLIRRGISWAAVSTVLFGTASLSLGSAGITLIPIIASGAFLILPVLWPVEDLKGMGIIVADELFLIGELVSVDTVEMMVVALSPTTTTCVELVDGATRHIRNSQLRSVENLCGKNGEMVIDVKLQFPDASLCSIETAHAIEQEIIARILPEFSDFVSSGTALGGVFMQQPTVTSPVQGYQTRIRFIGNCEMEGYTTRYTLLKRKVYEYHMAALTERGIPTAAPLQTFVGHPSIMPYAHGCS